jgi:hypothetical protein
VRFSCASVYLVYHHLKIIAHRRQAGRQEPRDIGYLKGEHRNNSAVYFYNARAAILLLKQLPAFLCARPKHPRDRMTCAQITPQNLVEIDFFRRAARLSHVRPRRDCICCMHNSSVFCASARAPLVCKAERAALEN